MTDKKPVIVVCGPTATGKTDLALYLASHFNGELVSCDSRQLYADMTIGTGKDLPAGAVFYNQNNHFKFLFQSHNISKNRMIGYYIINSIPLWLYDIINPNEQLTAFEYMMIARSVLKDIEMRNKIPIVVGGSGLYCKALIDGMSPSNKPDPRLREHLAACSLSTLQDKLFKINRGAYESLNHSDANNPRRLIRALEKELQPLPIGLFSYIPINNDIIFIGLSLEQNTLYARIDNRVDNRLASGLLDEVTNLLKKGYSWDDPGFNTIGYREWRPYFESASPKNEIVTRWKNNEHAYAKRQVTWFKRDERIIWFDPSKQDVKSAVVSFIQKRVH